MSLTGLSDLDHGVDVAITPAEATVLDLSGRPVSPQRGDLGRPPDVTRVSARRGPWSG